MSKMVLDWLDELYVPRLAGLGSGLECSRWSLAAWVRFWSGMFKMVPDRLGRVWSNFFRMITDWLG